MDTLPQSNTTKAPQSATPPTPSVGNIAKEVVPVSNVESISQSPDVDRELSLPHEVAHAGIRMRSDTVTVPKTVAQLGVTVVSQPPVAATNVATGIVLPLNDEQIAQGLHQSITSSFRWLAEWCEKRLKEFHFIVRSIGGKAVREKV